MTQNLRKYDENRDVYTPPEIDSWYQLRFDHNSGYLVLVHHDRKRLLVKDGIENYYEMRRVVQRARFYSKDDKPSTVYLVLDKVLNNYKALRDNRQLKDYKYERVYKLSKNEEHDLTNIADYIASAGMPNDFANFFFHVKDGILIVRPVVTQADINKNKLDIDAMEKYVWSLKQLDEKTGFVSTKKAGWYPNGKPPIFKKYDKLQN